MRLSSSLLFASFSISLLLLAAAGTTNPEMDQAPQPEFDTTRETARVQPASTTSEPSATTPEAAAASSTKYYAVLETCPGWQLNHLPEVKKFVYGEAKTYKEMKVKYAGGAKPALLLFTSETDQLAFANTPGRNAPRDKIVDTKPLSELNQQQIRDLLTSLNIH